MYVVRVLRIISKEEVASATNRQVPLVSTIETGTLAFDTYMILSLYLLLKNNFSSCINND